MPTNEPIKILICILTTYERGGWICKELAEFIANLPLIPGYATRVVFAHNFSPAASARNRFCKQALEQVLEANEGPDWICMIDNDQAPPINFLDTIKNAPKDASIVVPAFYMWANDSAKLTLCWGVDDEQPRPNGFGHFPTGYHELSKCGTGAIFIRPRHLAKMPYPYFKYLYNEEGGMQGTEDIQFCLAARKAGLKIYGLSGMNVGHFHSVDLSVMAKILFDKPKETGVEESQGNGRSPEPAVAACSAPAT